MNWILKLLGLDDASPVSRRRNSETAIEVVRINGRPVRSIPRNTRPFHEERGWRRDGHVLRGRYVAGPQVFDGYVQNPSSSSPEFFILKPPREVLRGPHGPCFRERGRGVFSVHFNPRPRDVATGIISIQRTLAEALSS